MVVISINVATDHQVVLFISSFYCSLYITRMNYIVLQYNEKDINSMGDVVF